MQGGVETRAGGNRLARIPVHVDDVQVGKPGPQVIEIAEMGGRLQHPARGGRNRAGLPFLPLQELQHAVQIRVGGSEVLGVDPRSVLRHMGTGFGHVRQERVGEKDDLLLGFPGVHRMDGEQVRCQLTRDRLPPLTGRDPRVLGRGRRPLAVKLGCDLHHLPAVGALKAVVGAQQALQQGGATTHHAHHDDGSQDPLLGNLRVAPDPLLGAQPHPQTVNHTGPQDVHTDVVQIGGGVTGGEHVQWPLEREWTPVGQTLLLLCGRHDRGRVERMGHRAQNFRC